MVSFLLGRKQLVNKQVSKPHIRFQNFLTRIKRCVLCSDDVDLENYKELSRKVKPVFFFFFLPEVVEGLVLFGKKPQMKKSPSNIINNTRARHRDRSSCFSAKHIMLYRR